VRVDLALATGDRAVVSGGDTGIGVPLSELEALAVHPDGQRVFVTAGAHLVPLVVDVVTGERNLVTPASVGSGPAPEDPEGVALDAARGRLLIPDDVLDGVLAVDLATGDRSFLGDDTSVPLTDPEAIAVDPVGKRAVVIDSSLDACIAIDLDTGARTVLSSDAVGAGPQMQDPEGLALDAAGTTALVIDPSRGGIVFSVDLASALREYVSENNVGAGISLDVPEALILDQVRDRVLVADSGNGAVIAVDLMTGDRTEVATGGMGPDIGVPLGIALVTPDTALIYDDVEDYLLLDLVTGVLTSFTTADLRPGVLLSSPDDLTVDPTRNVLLVADEDLNAVIAVDMTTKERLIISR